jgi:hypothetical protein
MEAAGIIHDGGGCRVRSAAGCLTPYGGPQIEALLERWDRILALASRLARERGEENVLYP